MNLYYSSCILLAALFAAYFARGIWIEIFREKGKQRWRVSEKEVFYFKCGAKIMFISTAKNYEPFKKYKVGDRFVIGNKVWERMK